MKPLKIIIVDDNEPFRKALLKLLVMEYQADVLAEASSAHEFRALTNIHLADVILMDVMMPGTDGIALAKEAIWTQPKLKIIAITMHIDKVYLTSLIQAGFKGCIFKTKLFEELNIAIDTVVNGKLYFPEYISV